MKTSDNIYEAEKYFNIALNLHNNDELDKALEYYKKALELFPQYAAAISNIGNIFTVKKMFKKAIEMQKKAILVDRNYFYAPYNLGNIYMEIGDYINALSTYNSALTINNIPNEFRHYLYHNIAVCYHDGFEDLKNAIEYCRKALLLDPNDNETEATLNLYLKQAQKININEEVFIDCHPQNDSMDNYMKQILKQLRRHLILSAVRISYNLLTPKIFDDPGMIIMSAAKIGETTSTMGFNIEQYKDRILGNKKIYLCYVAVPVDEDDYLIEDDISDEIFCSRLENLIDSEISSIGAISFSKYPRCKTFKWIYKESSEKDIDSQIDINNLKFLSSSHIRFENGIDNYGIQKGANRGIAIEKHESIPDAYKVTIFNMDGAHPDWGTNIQMHPKKMEIVSQDNSKIELRGIGNDFLGVPFSGYGITLNLKNDEVERVILHMFDRKVDIEYFK